MAINTSELLINSSVSQQLSQNNAIEHTPNKNPTKSKQSIKSAAKKAFASFASHWEYINKGIGLTRRTITLITESGALIEKGFKKTYQVLKQSVLYLKFFAIISIPLGIAKIPSQAKQLKESVLSKDHEGSILSGLSLTTLTVGLFESITSFVNTTIEVISHSPIRWMAAIGRPIGMGLAGINSVKKCHHIYHLCKFSLDLKHNVLNKIENDSVSPSEITEVLKPFLNKYLGSEDTQVPENQTKKFKARVLERQTNDATVARLNEISDLMNQIEPITSTQATTIRHTLKEIKKDLKDEKLCQAGLILTSVISVIAFATFSLSNPFIPFGLMATSTIGQIAIKIHEDKKNQKK